jgi:hypothetical protein
MERGASRRRSIFAKTSWSEETLTEAAWQDEGMEKNVCDGIDPVDSSVLRCAIRTAAPYEKF